MIEVDVWKVIQQNLNEGETLDGERTKLTRLAREHMWRHRFGRRGLYERIKADEDAIRQCEELLKKHGTFGDLHSVLKKNSEVWRRYREVWFGEHVKGYLGEIAMHAYFQVDWHQVYRFNNIEVSGHQPDGLLGKDYDYSYDVKTRSKNKWGLAVYNEVLVDDFYVLAHLYKDKVYLIAYTSKEELEPTKEHSRFDNYWMPASNMHPIEYLAPAGALGSDVYLGFEKQKVTQRLPRN
jgi:hypothetical protein